MLKKLTATVLLTAVTQVYAFGPVAQSVALSQELNKSFEELNYKLNVEWNQKDEKFLNFSMDNFEKEIKSLQEKGLSNEDLVRYILENVKDSTTKIEIQTIANVILENQLSSDEARAFMLSKINSLYSNGTSWSGRRHGHHVAVLIGMILLIVYCSHQHDGKTGPQGPQGPQGEPGGDGCLTHGFASNNGLEHGKTNGMGQDNNTGPFGPPPFCFPPSTK